MDTIPYVKNQNNYGFCLLQLSLSRTLYEVEEVESEKIPIEKPNLFQYLMYVTFRSFIMINVYISYFWCCWHNPKIGCRCL